MHRTILAAAVTMGLAACAGARPAGSRDGIPPPFASVADQVLITPGARLRFRDYSAGTAVILLHGYTDRLETMQGLADSLAPTHRVIALDVRGFGGSTTYSDPARYGPAMVEDVIQLMDARGVHRAHVVGYSMGALMAANLVAHHPDRVLSATLLGVPWFADTAATRAFLAPYVESMRQDGNGFREFLRWTFPRWGDSVVAAVSDSVTAVNDRGAMIAVLEALPALTVDEPGRLGGVRALIIVGQDDPLVGNSLALADAWPGAQLLTLPGADHERVLTRPSYIDAVRVHFGNPASPAE